MKTKLIFPTMIFFVLLFTVTALSYNDTDGHWAGGAIDSWSEKGLINGKENGCFCPDDTITRAESAAVLSRLLKLEATADLSVFSDVDKVSWYYEAISHCVAAGILNGDNGKMNPNAPVTREMFFTMISRALNIIPERELKHKFSDISQISDWSKKHIASLVNQGYVNGVSATELAPKSYITRASAVTLIDRIVKNYGLEVLQTQKSGVSLVLSDCKVDKDFSGTVIIYASDTKVSLAGAKGAFIIIKALNVTVTEVPAGSFVTVDENSENVTVNTQTLKKDSINYVSNKEVIYMTTAKNKFKEEYQEPEIEIVEFEDDDIIQTSTKDEDKDQGEWDELYK